MNVVEAHRQDVPRELIRTAVPDLEPNVESGSLVVDADTGDPVALVAPYSGDLAAWRTAARGFPRSETVRLNGTRNAGTTFGFAAKKEVLRRSTCRACSVALTHPEQHAVIAGAADTLATMLREYQPRRAELDEELARSVIRPEWFMGGWWTSGVLNFSSPLPYHFDANNLRCWSAMITARRGARGGHLHVPAYDLVLPCRDGDVLFFAGYERMHGVTPIRLPRDPRTDKPNGYRITAVYYVVSAMQHCGEFDEGFDQGRRKRSRQEDTMLERQTADGMIR